MGWFPSLMNGSGRKKKGNELSPGAKFLLGGAELIDRTTNTLVGATTVAGGLVATAPVAVAGGINKATTAAGFQSEEQGAATQQVLDELSGFTKGATVGGAMQITSNFTEPIDLEGRLEEAKGTSEDLPISGWYDVLFQDSAEGVGNTMLIATAMSDDVAGREYTEEDLFKRRQAIAAIEDEVLISILPGLGLANIGKLRGALGRAAPWIIYVLFDAVQTSAIIAADVAASILTQLGVDPITPDEADEEETTEEDDDTDAEESEETTEEEPEPEPATPPVDPNDDGSSLETPPIPELSPPVINEEVLVNRYIDKEINY